jgi:hypothetical protein
MTQPAELPYPFDNTEPEEGYLWSSELEYSGKLCYGNVIVYSRLMKSTYNSNDILVRTYWLPANSKCLLDLVGIEAHLKAIPSYGNLNETGPTEWFIRKDWRLSGFGGEEVRKYLPR